MNKTFYKPLCISHITFSGNGLIKVVLVAAYKKSECYYNQLFYYVISQSLLTFDGVIKRTTQIRLEAE